MWEGPVHFVSPRLMPLNQMSCTASFLQENQKVKKDLLEAQTSIAFLQSELDALRSDYANQSLNSERYGSLHFVLQLGYNV